MLQPNNTRIDASFVHTTKVKIIVSAISCFFALPIIAAENIDLALDPIAVTANPLGVGSDALVTPVSTLNGRALSLGRESTLGETLNGMLGVTATQFGPNASRPVIRGLDAERVRILQNGVGILDASSLSFDHAVGIDPLIIEQIDVVRGPAALLYGGSAIGGVVNAIDHRIPTESLDGIVGRTEARIGGANNQRNGAVVIDAGNGQFVMHADAYGRKTDDLSIPEFAVSQRKQAVDGTTPTNHGKLKNSNAQSDGGALGAAITFDHGYIGASFATLHHNYGTVAEEDVRIDMTSDRWDIASEFTDINTWFNRLKIRLAHTDYQHQELEGTAVGTTFKNRGFEGSIEIGHTPLATGHLPNGMQGVVGVQLSNTHFSASGEEAFVPNVNTRTSALYFYEEMTMQGANNQNHQFTIGGRLGHTEVNALPSDQFGARIHNAFNPKSIAIGGLFHLNEHWSLASNWSHNERAPSYFELYANGAHIATHQFEVGNTNFGLERANGIDAQLRWKTATSMVRLNAYYTRFDDFIGLFNTGNTIEIAPGKFLAEAQFNAVTATFKGVEMEGKFTLNNQVNVSVRGDYIHAKNNDTQQYLPRISPLRLGAKLNYQHNRFNAQLSILHAFKQHKIAANTLATNRYTNLSALMAYKLPSKRPIELFAKANNLLNDDIREHASFLKDIAPAGARSILIGVRADF